MKKWACHLVNKWKGILCPLEYIWSNSALQKYSNQPKCALSNVHYLISTPILCSTAQLMGTLSVAKYLWAWLYILENHLKRCPFVRRECVWRAHWGVDCRQTDPSHLVIRKQIKAYALAHPISVYLVKFSKYKWSWTAAHVALFKYHESAAAIIYCDKAGLV